MKNIKSFNEMALPEREVIFTHKRNKSLEIKVTKTPDGRITSIENNSHVGFPFLEGQVLNRMAEVWACKNSFLMDGKETCSEKKLFGIRTKDIPQGHELRMIYPNKF